MTMTSSERAPDKSKLFDHGMTGIGWCNDSGKCLKQKQARHAQSGKFVTDYHHRSLYYHSIAS